MEIQVEESLKDLQGPDEGGGGWDRASPCPSAPLCLKGLQNHP